MTPLADGLVLILGGRASEVEVFDPDTSTISILPAALTLRQRGSVTLLTDGRLLIAGGTAEEGTLSAAERDHSRRHFVGWRNRAAGDRRAGAAVAHAFTLRFPGSALFQASEAQVTVRVQ